DSDMDWPIEWRIEGTIQAAERVTTDLFPDLVTSDLVGHGAASAHTPPLRSRLSSLCLRAARVSQRVILTRVSHPNRARPGHLARELLHPHIIVALSGLDVAVAILKRRRRAFRLGCVNEFVVLDHLNARDRAGALHVHLEHGHLARFENIAHDVV